MSKKSVLLNVCPSNKNGYFCAYVKGTEKPVFNEEIKEEIVENEATIEQITTEEVATKEAVIEQTSCEEIVSEEATEQSEDEEIASEEIANEEIANEEIVNEEIESKEATDDTSSSENEEITSFEQKRQQELENALESGKTEDTDEPLDKNIKLMSPTQMVVRRFFRSKLSIVGLIMVIGLFVFSFLGPYIYTQWDSTTADPNPKLPEYAQSTFTYEIDGKTFVIKQVTEQPTTYNKYDMPTKSHPLGTDESGYDILARLMYGGRISLTVSFLSVFLVTILGVIFGGIAGYFGGVIDNVIMRICDILMCLPGLPILLIVGMILDMPGLELDGPERIYVLMAFLSIISWTGTARLVRGQILSLREQEYMVAAEAMGYSSGRKIFKHLIPNVMPQLIVQMTLSLGSMILYEATLSYLNLGVRAPHAAWGTMISIISKDPYIITEHPFLWIPAGLCIVIAVLGFNFIGDGLRDALDPKMRR